MASFSQFGNDLYTGRRQLNIVGRRRTWYAISAVFLVLALVGLFGRGLNLSLEFKGGSELRVTGISNLSNYDARAQKAVASVTGSSANLEISKVGAKSITIDSKKVGNNAATTTDRVSAAVAQEFKVPTTSVDSQFIGPSWGSQVTHKAVQALIVFLVLVSLLLGVYFRTWKMAVSALVALVHDLVLTVGIYALVGIEVSPATVIGFLTILGYSIYDTVVVFDKVRENTDEALATGSRTYTQAANYAVNQTLVRSINTSVVALLPIAALLVVGFTVLGPGTLLDLALALFIGIAVGTYSSIFIATPLLASLRSREPQMHDLERRAHSFQTSQQAVLAETGGGAASEHLQGEDISGVVEPERAEAAAAARRTRVRKREVHPLAVRDNERD
ncbi:protein translocase subunit SecF [Allobranchiibius sp. CTAmp26]|uniref:protein translocase subunit SecF n=1 Tax=Allobranchiibius sp. CTAmp26 TaxID=2815214 RepID=UPI001AA19182|nr:protein translocase subunit SecF [Allobranchiibius sp. CTAmp26]MBO1754367.1 protein translocase subunit SecF [Allobranchiibius sp. CTAmp26]